MTDEIEEITATYEWKNKDFAAFCHANTFYTQKMVYRGWVKKSIGLAIGNAHWFLTALLFVSWILWVKPPPFDAPFARLELAFLVHLTGLVIFVTSISSMILGFINYRSKIGVFRNVFDLHKNEPFELTLTRSGSRLRSKMGDRKYIWPSKHTLIKLWKNHLIIVIPDQVYVIPVETLNVEANKALETIKKWIKSKSSD
ncbi:MAG: hypothetical protein JKY31_14115 [Rhodobacteraceae bacterium]|nr:hypothetical protein [Paracoccaceae bacterium]